MRLRPAASCLFGAALLGLVILIVGSIEISRAQSPEGFRVCADPNNLPFSDQNGNGFENKIAELIAADLGETVRYSWWAQRRGFVRNTLKEKLCDVLIGVPQHYDPVLASRAYYRSAYVFVSRADRKLRLSSLRDPQLRNVRIGVHLIGDDGMNTPPAHALGELGMIDNVVGYSIYGDYRVQAPPARLIEAVEAGDIDVAVAWGPLAGFAARNSTIPLQISLVSDGSSFSPLRFQFDIAMGVRKGDHARVEVLNRALSREGAAIRSILEQYGVPLVENTSAE